MNIYKLNAYYQQNSNRSRLNQLVYISFLILHILLELWHEAKPAEMTYFALSSMIHTKAKYLSYKQEKEINAYSTQLPFLIESYQVEIKNILNSEVTK